jgi:hypothetical protein
MSLTLAAKAKLGIWDAKYASYYHVPVKGLHPDVKKAITRAYAKDLVPTATTNGVHAPMSLHSIGHAVDIGCRNPADPKQRANLLRFQRGEHWRAQTGRVKYQEILGPINSLVVLRGKFTDLSEGSALEEQHDNHVHVAF